MGLEAECTLAFWTVETRGQLVSKTHEKGFISDARLTEQHLLDRMTRVQTTPSQPKHERCHPHFDRKGVDRMLRA